MNRFIKRAVPAVVSLLLAAAPVTAYADEFIPEPGMPYDEATAARLKDHVLEYDEIEMLIEEYNTTLKNLKETYQDQRDSLDDLDAVKRQIANGVEQLWDASAELSTMAAMFESMLGYQSIVTPGTYAELVYSSALLENQAEQTRLSADQLTQITPEMMRIQMLDTSRAALSAGAQSALIGYEQLLLQKDSLKTSIELLEAVYQSAERQAAAGLATQNDVITARQNLESTQAVMLTLEANEVKIRQTLCTMLGWDYNAVPEIRAVPAVDLSRIDAMDLAADTEAAVNNNFTLTYNLLSKETLTDGSVELQNLLRTIEAEKAEIASLMVNLHNSVLQARNEYQTAQAAFGLEETKMTTADRKMSLGMLGSLEYMQQKNSYKTAEVAVRNAELALFQALETYDWAVRGNLTLSQ